MLRVPILVGMIERINYLRFVRIFHVIFRIIVECGIQTTRNYISIEGLNKIAKAGDWPWHVALFKDGVHACDATLVSQHWLLTTISCFQGFVFDFKIPLFWKCSDNNPQT